jgi:hypothetical protein
MITGRPGFLIGDGEIAAIGTVGPPVRPAKTVNLHGIVMGTPHAAEGPQPTGDQMMSAPYPVRTCLVLVGLIAVASCGNINTVPDAGSGAAGSNAAGAAGSTGRGGATGGGGTTGNGGTTGSAGSTGSGGATGAAGAAGSTGRGGATGAAGSTGRGGSGAAGAAGTGAGGRGGSGGATGAAGAAGSGAGRGGSGGAGGTAGSSPGRGGAGGRDCATILCQQGRLCCDGACVNPANDPFNCGACGKVCPNDARYCAGGTCQRPECSPVIDCAPNATCCGNSCCTTGQLCCEQQGPVSGGPPTCHTPTPEQPSCPQGCAPLCISDRNQKKDIAPVDTAEILKKVGALPISTWSYTSEPAEIRHLGPMAQDFRASFGLGNDDRSYHSVDAHGVALAAIQALERIVAEQEKRIQRLERENRRLARRR